MIVNDDKLLDVAWQAASAAGQLIRESWQKPKSIEYKGAIDLVTSVDRESERDIVEPSKAIFPITRFSPKRKRSFVVPKSECRWIVDPLDGTTNFAHGYPQFCISIAFENRGIVIMGLVYDPVRQECFKAVRAGGATLNDAPIHTSSVDRVDKALLATGFPYDHRDYADVYLGYFKGFMTRSQGVRRGGSAALDLCYVASGRLDGFWEMKLKPWDVAAGALIVIEAGGVFSDFSGNAFSMYGQETLASNRLIHREMVGIVSAVARETRVD